LIPCLKSATRTSFPKKAVSTLCGSCDPPTTGSAIAGFSGRFAVKIMYLGIRIYPRTA